MCYARYRGGCSGAARQRRPSLTREPASARAHGAVFVWGCTLEVAEAVCQAVDALAAGPEQSLEVLDGVASLVDKRLLRQQEQASGKPRFRRLETIRE
jgi:hypothetical protein